MIGVCMRRKQILHVRARDPGPCPGGWADGMSRDNVSPSLQGGVWRYVSGVIFVSRLTVPLHSEGTVSSTLLPPINVDRGTLGARSGSRFARRKVSFTPLRRFPHCYGP